MAPTEVDLWVDALLLKIHVISGWTLPSGQLFTIIQDQFRKLLTEEFFELNPDEIEYAFRTRSDTVEYWGKNLNLGLINKILKPYLKERYYISDMEAKMKYQPDGYCDAASLNWWRGRIEQSYETGLSGERPYLYPYMYDVLVQDGMIEKGYYKTRFSELQREGMSNDQQNAETAKLEAVLHLFREAKAQGLKNIYQKA